MTNLNAMAGSAASDSNKRRKLSLPGALQIIDLPDAALAAVATFLPKPSQALFAIAMTLPLRESSSSWKLIPSSAETNQSFTPPKIVCCHGNWRRCDDDGGWSKLDFADIDISLASKLTDDHVRGILLCIDGANRLRTLRLTGCTNITGSGLMSLSGSTVLEQIDLSIVKGNANHLDEPVPLPRISEQDVVPILNSIIDATGNSLRQVQLPKKFRDEPSAIMDDFIERYDELLEERGGICDNCDFDEPWGNMDGSGNPWVFEDHESPSYGLQNYTCYECTSHVCVDICLQFCTNCEKSYCTDCIPFTVCRHCPTQLCKSCGVLTECKHCGYHACDSCSSMGECHQKSCWLPGVVPPFAGKRGMG